MKKVFVILFAAAIAASIACIPGIWKSKKDIKRQLLIIFGSVIIDLIANLRLLFPMNLVEGNICHGIYFVSLDIGILEMLIFCLNYIKARIKSRKFISVLKILFGLDCIDLLISIPAGHAFESVPVLNEAVGEVVTFNPQWPFIFHLLLDYFSLTVALLILLYKTIKSPRVYKFRYASILSTLFISIGLNGIFLISSFPFDISILFFAVIAFFIYYFSIVYTPKALITKSLSMVVDNLDDAVIFYNEDRECIYKNNAWESKLYTFQEMGLSPSEPFKYWAGSSSVGTGAFQNMEDQHFNQEIKKDDKYFYFSIWFHNLRDEKKRYLGTFFQVHDRTEEVLKDQENEFLAKHDPLTGLFNKQTFFNKASEYLKYHGKQDYYMIVSDVDNFKLLNDVFGRETADKFLVNIAEEIRHVIIHTNVYGRIGNDRFAILLPSELYDEKRLLLSGERLQHIDVDKYYPVTIHFGIYKVEDIRLPINIMCDRASMAIDSVKGNMNRHIAYYTPEIRAESLREQKLVGEFHKALEEKQFHIYLQPQIDQNGECHGAEALSRWIHPKDGIIHPTEFINLFERNGIITELDRYVWNLACEKLAEWKDRGHNDWYISVNISPKDLAYANIYEEFTDLVSKYDVNPKNLHLEITESGLMMNFEAQVRIIDQLRNAGFSVEMDDFGSGYSSLNLLKDVIFDVIKVDMEFLKETLNEKRAQKILENIVQLSKNLEIPVIIEGVEKVEQYKALQKMGADIYQGYYFDKPMEIKDFEKKYLTKQDLIV